MDDILIPALAIGALFIGLPWIVLHYVTKWRQAARITPEDEALLDEMHALARRLEDRVRTVERIVAADHPDFRPEPRADLSAPPPGRSHDLAGRRPADRPADRFHASNRSN